MPLDCSSRPETPKILVITTEFVSKNCFFADFFCGFTPKFVKFAHFLRRGGFFCLHPRIRENPRIIRDEDLLVITADFVELRDEDLRFLVHTLVFEVLKFLCPPKFVYAPQSRYPGAGPDLQIAKTDFCDISPKCWYLVGQMICYLCGYKLQCSLCTARRTANTSMHNKINFATTVNCNTKN